MNVPRRPKRLDGTRRTRIFDESAKVFEGLVSVETILYASVERVLESELLLHTLA